MKSVYVDGKAVRLDPRRVVGKGGEADVYRFGPDRVLKVWKRPDHPDLCGLSQQMQAAAERLRLLQKKMPAFPPRLPGRVVAPLKLAFDKLGQRILGYSMPFIQDAEALMRYADRGFRAQFVPNATVCRIFLDLEATVRAVHKRGVLIGDFNDLNVLVRKTEAYLIDSDSFQFGGFACTVFTPRFFDPLLCDPRASELMPGRPFTRESDWYAFSVLLMQSLLFVGPYGGVYRPQKSSERLPPQARPLKRITVFHPQVRYPKPAAACQSLSDDTLHYFHEVFERDRRGPFPKRLLESVRWSRCSSCGLEHCRAACPGCQNQTQVQTGPVVVRGKVRAWSVLKTSGTIVRAATWDNQLVWLVHQDGEFIRETGQVVLRGSLHPGLRFGLCGPHTWVGHQGRLVRLGAGGPHEAIGVDQVDGCAAFDTNGRHCYWMDTGRLYREGPHGPEFVGDVLAGQTRFRVGPDFGFGLYRAAELCVAFVFSTKGRGIHDSVVLPPLRGKLIETRCLFEGERCYFLYRTQEGGHRIDQCAVVRRDGSVEVHAHFKDGLLSDLRSLCAVPGSDPALLCAHDDGILRLEPKGPNFCETRRFPDAEPFTDGLCGLTPSDDGLAVVSPREIRMLRME